MEAPLPGNWPEGRFEGREAFNDLFVQGLDRLLEHPVREMWLSDFSFGHWPLGQRAVVERLDRWAQNGGQARLLAADFGQVRLRLPRWAAWRGRWSHQIDARACGRMQTALPTTVWTPLWCLQRLGSDRGPVVASADPQQVLELREVLQAWWDKGVAAFPATTLGL